MESDSQADPARQVESQSTFLALISHWLPADPRGGASPAEEASEDTSPFAEEASEDTSLEMDENWRLEDYFLALRIVSYDYAS